GADEAGRGPLAGPVTAAAVIVPEDFSRPGLTDSRQLNEAPRELYSEQMQKEAIAYHISIIEASRLDEVNISEATESALTDAIIGLNPKPTHVLIDAVKLNVQEIQTKVIIKGDDKSLVIAAASILAKVKRDQLMKQIDAKYPAYEFSKNKGYGTKTHLKALQEFGPCPSHRKSFAPVSGM